MIRFALILPLAVLPMPAAAQIAPTLIREMAGPWMLIPTDGRPVCTIILATTSIGTERWRATPDAVCTRRVPGVAAWRPTEGMTLLDAAGRARMVFVEDETALPSYPDLQHPTRYFVPRIAGFTHLPQPVEWVGRWRLARKRMTCSVTLADKGRRIIASDCPKGTIPTRLAEWTTEGLNLNLFGPGDAALLLSPAGNGRYTDVASGWTLFR